MTAARAFAAPTALATISVQAQANYADSAHTSYSTTSNVVTVAVSTVALSQLATTQASCQTSIPGATPTHDAVLAFTLTNTGNTAESFLVTGAQLSGGTLNALSYVDSSGVEHAVTVNSTATPVLAPGAAINIKASIGPGTLAVNTQITLTLIVQDTTLNNSSIATATACTYVSQATIITSPEGPTIPVALTINGAASVQAQPGSRVTIQIAFEDSGVTNAQAVVVNNLLPTGLTFIPGTVRINGSLITTNVSVSNQNIFIRIPTLPPHIPYIVSFEANVSNDSPKGSTLVDTASLTSANAPTVDAIQASLFIGTGDLVYDAGSAQNAPVQGALLSVINAVGTPLVFSATGVPPNTANTNPFATGADGAYSFLVPASTTTANNELDVSAPGFLHRRIALTLRPAAVGGFFQATLTALDGQPLAEAGQFTLHNGNSPIVLNAVNGFFGNIPLFRSQPFTINVFFDRSVAAGGDRVLITIRTQGNASGYKNVDIGNLLPPGLQYIYGTSKIDGLANTPVISGQRQNWTLATISEDHTITFIAVVSPSAQADQSLTDEATAQYALPGSNQAMQASATATLQIVNGLFSQRIVITGRVAATSDDCGASHRHDIGIAGVRIYLEDGELAVTDANGRYSFPAAAPLAHVLSLDTTTFPAGFTPCPIRPGIFQTGGAQRFVHGIDDSDTMQDVNFSLRTHAP